MPTPIPNRPSDRTILARTPRPTDDSSRQIFRTWDERIKEQATFSARTTNEAYLDSVRKVLAAISSRQVTPQDGERHLRTALQNLGYRPDAGFPDARGTVPPAKPGSIRDLSSSRRIQLIIDTNVKQARSLGQVATSEDPKMLMTAPAWKLTRTGARKKPRGDWRRRWQEAGKACNWYGASKNQMVALKTSPIWQSLANGAGGFKDTLGSPFPPFAFGSGMAWVNVDWDDWEELCRKEGIPDHLDDITAKARALKAAKSGQIAPAKAATVAPTVQPDGNRGRDGADVSPLLRRIGPQAAVHPRTTPVPALFKPDLTARLRADKAVDDGIAAIRKDEATVAECAQGIGDFMEKAKKALDANPEAKAHLSSRMGVFDRYAEAADKAAKELKSLEGRVVNYGSSVAATPRPTENGQQGPYDAKMRMIVQAVAKTVRSAHTAAVAAKLRLDAAGKTADAIIKDAEVDEKANCLAMIREELYQPYMDLDRGWVKVSEEFYNADAKIPESEKTPAYRMEADKFRHLEGEVRKLGEKIEESWHSIQGSANDGDTKSCERTKGWMLRDMGLYRAAIDSLRKVADSVRKIARSLNGTRKTQDRKINRIAKMENHPEVKDNPEVRKAVERMQAAADSMDDEAFEVAHKEAVKAADMVWKPVTKNEIATNAAMAKIGAKHTVGKIDAAKATNPNFGKNAYKGQWDQNCQRCVPCAELISRGYKVTAKPLPKRASGDHLLYHWQDAFIGGKTVHFKDKADAERIMKSWGDGARAEIRVAWKGASGSGHVFLAEVVGDTVEFTDPQSGKTGYSPWNNVVTRGMYVPMNVVMRIDNLEPNPQYIVECCEPA